MKQRLLILLFAIAVLLLALGGWAVEGLRWVFSVPLRLRVAPATLRAH